MISGAVVLSGTTVTNKLLVLCLRMTTTGLILTISGTSYPLITNQHTALLGLVTKWHPLRSLKRTDFAQKTEFSLRLFRY
jgi:hypothetical protein